MNGLTASLFLGADQDMPLPPPSTLASSTLTPDNTGSVVVSCSSIGMAVSLITGHIPKEDSQTNF